MAGTSELYPQQQECNFEWDDSSHLYYHSSTGFYYNPNEGWYYNSRDGSYYIFENGNYVLLGSGLDSDQVIEGNQTIHIDTLKQDCEDPAQRVATLCVEHDNGPTMTLKMSTTETTQGPPPPSEWLEDTLIDLYLAGYPNDAAATDSENMMPLLSNDIEGGGNTCKPEEGEWIPEDLLGSAASNRNIPDPGTLREKEKWLAQYGQVTESNEESGLDVQIVDLWDWEMIRGDRKGGKSKEVRLVGRLVEGSSKLHPSLPSGRARLKTAPVREAHLDLILVSSGQIYRLRRPSLQHLASVMTYDSADPTKDMGFPQLSTDRQIQNFQNLDGRDASVSVNRLPALKKERQENSYRDRAAERRTLHGGFGIGHGQKKVPNASDSPPSSPTSACQEEAFAESLNISFGAGSYARKLLKSMGWKEGEALGQSSKGLVEPLQAVGNKGNAGLGWDNSRKH